MCEPTMALAAMGGATGLGTYAAYAQQDAANKAASYQGKMLSRNAALLEDQAKDIERRGFLAESEARKRVSAIQGAQRAMFAGAGVDVLSGSAMQVFQETEMLGDQDALTVRYNAAMEAYGSRHQAMNLLAQRRLVRSGRSPAWLSGATALLSGGSQTAAMGAQFSAAGLI